MQIFFRTETVQLTLALLVALSGCSGATGVPCRTPEGHGDNVPVVGEQSQHWWSGLSHGAVSCRVLQGRGKGTDPVCAGLCKGMAALGSLL